jgi:hypothetical protein
MSAILLRLTERQKIYFNIISIKGVLSTSADRIICLQAHFKNSRNLILIA